MMFLENIIYFFLTTFKKELYKILKWLKNNKYKKYF